MRNKSSWTLLILLRRASVLRTSVQSDPPSPYFHVSTLYEYLSPPPRAPGQRRLLDAALCTIHPSFGHQGYQERQGAKGSSSPTEPRDISPLLAMSHLLLLIMWILIIWRCGSLSTGLNGQRQWNNYSRYCSCFSSFLDMDRRCYVSNFFGRRLILTVNCL